MSEKTPLSTSDTVGILSTDWCNLTDPPCPYSTGSTGGICGIKSHLRGFPTRRARIAEAKRLLNDAKENPEVFWEICGRAI